MSGSLYISGLSSGIDWTSMVSQLMAVSRNPITLLEEQQDSLSAKQEAWEEFNTKLQSLQTALSALSSVDDFDVFTSETSITGPTSDAEDLLSVAVGTNATQGTYTVQVNQIATAAKVRSDAVADSTAELGLSGTFTVNGTEITIASTDTLSTLQDKINEYEDETGVTASILTDTDGNSYLTLTATETGADSLTLTDTDGILQSLGVVDASGAFVNEVIAGQDAEFVIDGITMTSSSNTITDVISGVTLSLTGADENSTITLDIVSDTDSIKSKIQTFVSAYNSVMDFISEQNTVADDDGEKNPLFGDTSMQSIKSSIRSTILSGVSGLDSTLDHLSLIGINLDSSGQLSIDDETLDGYLETNFDDVVAVFAGDDDTISGIADTLTEALDNMTDSISGFVSEKIDSLQSQIDKLDDKIAAKEDSLARYEETLNAKFTAMETALAELFATQSWLTTQLASLSSSSS